MLLFAVTIFLSAFLLFQVQPLIAKMILPWFGGTAAVWATCLLFFQTALLGGYSYSHFIVSRLRPKTQWRLHSALLAAALAFMPIIPNPAWKPLTRPPRYEVKTQERDRPENVKERVIIERNFQHLRLAAEHVAEIAYRPAKCHRPYRLIITRKTIDNEVGGERLWQEYRYFFHITNDDDKSPEQLVLLANQRCDQENLIEQLKNGVKAMKLPVDNLISNWAYMVMASLAWTLKAWWGLMLPEAAGRGRERRRQQKRDVLRMEFKRFAAAIMRLPCQIIRGARQLIYGMLSYSPWQEPLLAGAAAWRTRTQC